MPKTMNAPAHDEKFRCPITKACTTHTRHRRCKKCRTHCWDCCSGCSGDAGVLGECPGQAEEITYDLPEGVELTGRPGGRSK